ncbi:MAG TPA: transporter substrate-binding domain-containing protein [Methanocorpusculum sp.]|nr:transporter substrate-binding domain-containing protein [Methanocorpusculum sp.]
MKKGLIAIAAVLLILAVVAAAGCTSTTATDQPAAGDKPVLVMATNAEFQPYEYYDNGKIVGIDAEMMEAVANELGMTLKIEDMKFDTIITAVSTGKADVGAAAMTVTEDRLKNIDFSDTYATSKQVIVVNKTGDKKIESDADFAGARIGVQLGTTGDIYVSDYEDSAKEIMRLNNAADLFQALEAKKIDCIVIDEQPALKYSAKADSLTILEKEFTNEDYAIAIKKGNTELKDKINAALTKLKENGTLDAIVAKYIN